MYPFACGPSPEFDRPEASKLKLQWTLFLQNESTHSICSNLANIALMLMFSHVLTMNLCDENSPKLRERVAVTFSEHTPSTTSDAIERYLRHLSFFINKRQVLSTGPLYSAPGVVFVLRDRRLMYRQIILEMNVRRPVQRPCSCCLRVPRWTQRFPAYWGRMRLRARQVPHRLVLMSAQVEMVLIATGPWFLRRGAHHSFGSYRVHRFSMVLNQFNENVVALRATKIASGLLQEMV